MDARDRNLATVERLWALLYAKAWDELPGLFAPDAEYTDVPTPADDVARGPAQIVARLRLGLDPIEAMVHLPGLVVADDHAVMTEHAEEWHFHTGEVATVRFVSVHELDGDARITRWWDYWDLNDLMAAAPAWWVEHVMAGGDEA